MKYSEDKDITTERKTFMKRIEKHIEQMLVKSCKEAKIKTIKGDSYYKGFPDRIVFDTNHQKIYYVEVKNEGYYKITEMQKYWSDIIKKSGGLFFLITGEDEMNAFINTYIKGEKK